MTVALTGIVVVLGEMEAVEGVEEEERHFVVANLTARIHMPKEMSLDHGTNRNIRGAVIQTDQEGQVLIE